MSLEQGDVILVDFNPSVGHEPAKLRPAVVVSGYGFNSRANLVAVVPTTCLLYTSVANATAGECPIDARSFTTLREISGIRAGTA